jgi:tetratricopeptide (TPR) repeat protein
LPAKRLAGAEPDRADYQRDLSVSYERLGDLQRALGHGEQALELFTQSLEIAQRLAGAEPDRADYQRDLSISYNRLATSAMANDRSAALKYLSLDLQIARRLLALQPASADAAIDVAISLIQIAPLVPDPASPRREARSILERLRAAERLNPHGHQMLSQLDNQ